MQCPRCQHDNEGGAKFCENCASPLARTCSNCGRPLSPVAKFCPECAHPAPVAGNTSATPRFTTPEAYTPKLGRFFRETGNREKAREHLSTAASMYREMGMAFRLEQTEAEMKELT